MIFKETILKGAFVIELEPSSDERGFYARSWCQREFKEHGLNPALVQCGISYNKKKGTLRGMHYQAAPQAQAKLVRCGRGSVYDVIVDVRPESATFKKWVAVELTADNRRMLYVPEGMAHGFQTLEDDTEVLYQMTEFHDSESDRGVRWDDPAFRIDWPSADRIMSERDRAFPEFHEPRT
jgi:dTDP-4-dehydrorhamnose 3,5-epimerase